jgi:hypothetical protein
VSVCAHYGRSEINPFSTAWVRDVAWGMCDTVPEAAAQLGAASCGTQTANHTSVVGCVSAFVRDRFVASFCAFVALGGVCICDRFCDKDLRLN